MKTLLIFLLLVSSSIIFSQSKQERIENARKQITTLKEGTLLVRLQVREKTIELLKEKGLVTKAAYFEKKQEKENFETVRAFKNYTFGEKLFFYSSDADSVKLKKFDHVVFMNDSMEKVKFDPSKGYLIAAIGNLPKNYEHEVLDSTSSDNKNNELRPKKKNYTGGSDLSVMSLYLLNTNFELLTKPFPFHQRFHPVILTKLTTEEVVSRLNKKLISFYEK